MATLLSALFLIALTSSTALANKPTVAILGLEVVDPSGIDAASTSVARDLTEGLRARAKAGTGPYQLAIGSDKELIDEKLIHNCDESIGCMSEIGKNLGANFLIYGRLEKKPEGYVVTINLLNVDKKKMEKAKSPLTITQKDQAAVATAARKAYNDLTGTSELGTLVITANAERGTVLLDDEPKGNLNSGTVTLTGLKEGRYRLAIEADGFQRSPEVTVTIRSGESATQQITLVAGKKDDLKHEYTGTTSQKSGSPVKYAVFGVAVAAGIASGALWYFAWDKEQDLAKTASVQLADAKAAGGTFTIPKGHDGCGQADLEAASPAFKDACGQRDRTKYGIIGVGVSVVLIGITGYLAFGGSGDATETRPPTATAGRKKRKPFTVTPVVSADGGGATFQLDW
jgi:hypothetical protein